MVPPAEETIKADGGRIFQTVVKTKSTDKMTVILDTDRDPDHPLALSATTIVISHQSAIPATAEAAGGTEGGRIFQTASMVETTMTVNSNTVVVVVVVVDTDTIAPAIAPHLLIQVAATGNTGAEATEADIPGRPTLVWSKSLRIFHQIAVMIVPSIQQEDLCIRHKRYHPCL